MDDIQDVSVHTVGEKVDLLASGWVGGRPTSPAPLPLRYGSVFRRHSLSKNHYAAKVFFLGIVTV